MRLISILLILTLGFVSCSHEIPEQRISQGMPGDTEVRPDPNKPKQKKAAVAQADIWKLIFVVAAVAAAAKALSAAERGNCNDCLGDGVVHPGDPRSVRVTVLVRRAYSCPLCGGDGHR